MSKQAVVVSLSLAVVAVLGLGAWLYLDDIRGPSIARPKEDQRPGSGKVDFREIPSSGRAPQDFVSLTPEQQKAVKDSLEKLVAEEAARQVVAPGEVGAQEYQSCRARMVDTLPPDSRGKGEEVCACTVRALQKAFPEGKPTGSVRGSGKAFTRAYRAALARCIGEDGHDVEERAPRQ